MKDIDTQALHLAIAKLDKEFGKNTVIFGNALPDKVDVVPTGNFKLDLALGVGGFPKGRIIELFGAEALGKSLLSLSAVAECQAMGGLAAYLDVECDLDPDWATKLGVNLDDLVLAQPEYGEQTFTILHDLIKTNLFDLIVVDSVAAMTPKAELEGEMEDQQVGAQARMMAKGLRKTRHAVLEAKTCVIFINQIRDKIGFMQTGTTSPGGRALKFAASVRIELKRMGDAKNSKQEVVGTKVKALILKNKVARPMRALEFDVLHGVGFSNFGMILDLAEKHGLINKKGGGYYYKIGEDKSFAQGEAAAIEYLASDLEWVEELKKNITEKELA